MLAYVYAEDKNGLIGKGDRLPWSLPADVKFFKKVTMQGDVVMGRATYESIPNRPLKGRRNIVLTHNPDYEAPGAIVVNSKKEVLELYEKYAEDFYIIGGVSLFKIFEDDVDYLYRTVIHDEFDGNVYFPDDFDYNEFELEKSWDGNVDEKNKHPHTFEIWKRK